MPFKGGVAILMGAVTRTGVKIMTGFTGIVQMRAGSEMGGMLWTFEMLLAIATPFVAVHKAFEVRYTTWTERAPHGPSAETWHQCDLAGRRGVRGVYPRQPSSHMNRAT
jgi:hypothetical protein